MNFKKKYLLIIYIFGNILFSDTNEIQLVTTHKKSNGTLLRIVTKKNMDIEDIAGWAGQENWFYLTFNKTILSPSSMDYIVFEPPLMDLESMKNKESVQLGYLFERPIQDFEIFHSEASRVILIQVWDSLTDSIKSEVENSEGENGNLVFSLPSEEAKGSPFYDSFIYARDKYGPEKYFVWYNKWYSTQDIAEKNSKESIPKPLIVKNSDSLKKEKKTSINSEKRKDILKNPPIGTKTKRELREFSNLSPNQNLNVDISFILRDGLLMPGVKRSIEVKALQKALVLLGYSLGTNGLDNNGIDGNYGNLTEEAVINFQIDRGFNGKDIDGIVGEATYKELIRALAGQSSLVSTISPKVINQIENESNIQLTNSETAKDILKKPPISTQIKRETRKLPNSQEITLLPLDMTKRKTFLRLTCDVIGANVYIDGSYMGKTPIKKIVVNPGWHRIRVIDPETPRPQFSMKVPDYQDVYIPQGKSQKIRINLSSSEED